MMDFDEIEEATGYEQGIAAEYARQETQALLDELERKKRARAVAVPTDDGRVKKRLRELGEPITLFGERAADRRARLIQLLSRRGDDVTDAMEVDSNDSEEVSYRVLFCSCCVLLVTDWSTFGIRSWPYRKRSFIRLDRWICWRHGDG
jgi:hypothetical protein